VNLIPWIAGVAVLAAPTDRGTQRDSIEATRVLAEVPRLATDRLQLDFARLERSRLRRIAGERLTEARRRVARCYVAVRLYFPESRALAAEASFRAGELLRCAGDTPEALAELERVRVIGEGTDFRARAGIELGHIERRRRNWSKALDRYLAVASDVGTGPHWRDEAAIWAAKTYAAMGEIGEARRHLVRVTEAAIDPLARVRAFDEWALTYVVTGDVEAALGVLARGRESVAESAREETELGDRIRRALARMRCIRAIERSIESRRGSRALTGKGDDDE